MGTEFLQKENGYILCFTQREITILPASISVEAIKILLNKFNQGQLFIGFKFSVKKYVFEVTHEFFGRQQIINEKHQVICYSLIEIKA